MIFGTIGAGTIAQALARHLVSSGNRVILSNSRGPATLGGVVEKLGPLASAGTAAEAASADMVFLTVMWPDIPAALAGLPPWNGRVLVDVTNQIARLDPFEVADRVVKAFNTLYSSYIAPDPRHDGGRQVVFYAGDDAGAKQAFHAAADGIGFAPVDVGGLRDGGRLMQVGGGPLSALHVLKQD